ISAGVLAMDLDGDSNYELASAMNFNRLAVWEENYRLKRGYPVSFGSRGRHLPFVTPGSDQKYYLWQATDRGQIYRSELPDYEPVMYQPHWSCEYGNLQRTANYPMIDLPNQYLSDEIFVEDETYIFPNPLKSYYEQKLRLSVMPTQDLEVELKIFDIRGKLLYQKSALAFTYLHNTEIFEIPAQKLSSGIYIALVKGGNKTLQLRFGVEK
ncbi:MAG: T9SS type A sorting domain-containing protein, partial [Candidatus Cloacimonetes bacterium]|nr:T9SS type A sorting domain-containing protein [Candidatus Cloacimonadota bacterium]